MAKNSGQLPKWDLSALYRNEKDPLLAKNVADSKTAARKFSAQYKGKVQILAKKPESFLKALRRYEEILLHSVKPVMYAGLIFAESSTVEGRGAFLQKMRTQHVELDNEMLFFELEIIALGGRTLSALIKSPALSRYKHFLEKMAARQPHVLSEDLERVIADLGLTGRGAFNRLFTEEFANKKLFPKVAGLNSKEGVTSEKVLELLQNPSRKIRKEGAAALSRALIEEARTLSFISNNLVESKRIEDRYRKYTSPEAPRHLANEISQDMVDAMSGTVMENYPLIQDFYRFKRKLLGLSKLYDYDRYAPLGKSKAKISYLQSKDLILSAFRNFSPEFEKMGRAFFDGNWIDAEARPGKRGGGFCSFNTPDLHPYILVNFSEGFKETFTLAHELGHGIHACLMRSLSYLNFDVPLTIAETASIFAEMLLFDHLKTQTTDRKELLALYVKRIEGIFGTVFRQISMYKFEQDFHAARASRGELSADDIGKLWFNRQNELYGNSVELTPEYSAWWSYIPHFIHTPFYVYAYAFGELLTLSLFSLYKEKGHSFVPKYMEFLRTGGSKSPQELVAPFGITLKDPKFWQGGIKVIADLIEEAKALAK